MFVRWMKLVLLWRSGIKLGCFGREIVTQRETYIINLLEQNSRSGSGDGHDFQRNASKTQCLSFNFAVGEIKQA